MEMDTEMITLEFNINGKIVEVAVSVDMAQAILEDEAVKADVIRQLTQDNNLNPNGLNSRNPTDDSEAAEQFQWTAKSTMLLLELYRSELANLRNPKIKNSALWTKISNEIRKHGYNVTEEMCDRKFRNLKGTFKTIKDAKRKTGRGRQTWEYFDIMDEIFYTDATVNPPHLISSMTSQPLSILSSSPDPCPSAMSTMSSLHTISMNPSPSALSPLMPSTSGHLSQASSSPTSVVESFPCSLSSSSSSGVSSSNTSAQHVKKKNRDLEEFRKKILLCEENKVKELQEIKKIYKDQFEVQNKRNDVLKELVQLLKTVNGQHNVVNRKNYEK